MGTVDVSAQAWFAFLLDQTYYSSKIAATPPKASAFLSACLPSSPESY